MVTPKPYNFQSTKGFTDVEWKALHEIEEKHAEEFKHLMNRALNPFLYSDKEKRITLSIIRVTNN